MFVSFCVLQNTNRKTKHKTSDYNLNLDCILVRHISVCFGCCLGSGFFDTNGFSPILDMIVSRFFRWFARWLHIRYS